MRALIGALRGQGDLATLLVRLVMASILITAGYIKFFTAGIEKVTANFTGYGVVPFPVVAAPFIATLELVGGILLALGLFTRYLGVLYVFEFLLASYVKWMVIAAPGGGYAPARVDTLMVVVALLLATHGAGKYSLDAKMGRWDA